jgi:hypothetical protein
MSKLLDKITEKIQELKTLEMENKYKPFETNEPKPTEKPKPVDPKPVEKPVDPKPAEGEKPKFNTLIDLANDNKVIPNGTYMITVADNNITEIEQAEAVEMTEEEYELMFGAPMGNQNAAGAHDMGNAGSNTTRGSAKFKALWKTRNQRAFKKLGWQNDKGAARGAQERAAKSGRNVYQLKARRAAKLGKGNVFTKNVRIAASEQTPEVQLSRTDVFRLINQNKKQPKTE